MQRQNVTELLCKHLRLHFTSQFVCALGFVSYIVPFHNFLYFQHNYNSYIKDTVYHKLCESTFCHEYDVIC